MKTTIAAPVGAILACLAAPATALAGGEKIDVCHFDSGSGAYHRINVNDNAYPAHVDHGDASPGEAVPNMEGFEFGTECEVIASLEWCPQDGTLTETLGAHNFWFWVNGAPHGYTGTSETWIWWFNWGVYWDYFYGGDYLEFCVDEECSAPYGCYVPLS